MSTAIIGTSGDSRQLGLAESLIGIRRWRIISLILKGWTNREEVLVFNISAIKPQAFEPLPVELQMVSSTDAHDGEQPSSLDGQQQIAALRASGIVWM